MAAILPFLETEQYHFPEDVGAGASLAGLGSVAETEERLIAASNSEMTRLLWTRTLLQQNLASKTFHLAYKGGEIKMVITPKFDSATIPWARTSSDLGNFSLFSTNSKMRCPTFDLPAGSGKVGGACPAAGPAQTTSIGRGDTGSSILEKVGGKTRLKLYPEVEFNLSKTVCSYCYATGGKYGEPTVQIAELVRFAVVQSVLRDPSARERFIEAVVWQIPNLKFAKLQHGKDESNNVVDRRMKDYPDVVRVHSSGDFYDPKYASMWLEIANRLYATHGTSIILWAPTRTHVIPAWQKFWEKNPPPPNFSIRPSAYQLGDYAPSAPNLAGGTSVLVPEDAVASKGIKFDHQCGVYDIGDDQDKTCVNAMSPPGRNGEKPSKGCRACWVRPELRINYVAH